LVAIGALPDRGFGTPRHCWCARSLPVRGPTDCFLARSASAC
jgi:hypothetical protein